MKKLKGFTLIEILIALLLSGALSLTLVNALRYISLSSQKAARILLAHERGERVIAFVEQRILHCAFGLSACKSNNLFKKALGNGTDKELSVLALSPQWPIIIYQDGQAFIPVSETNGVYKGAAFAVIYAQESGLDLKISNPNIKTLLPGKSVEYIRLRGDINSSGLKSSWQYSDIRSWCVFPAVGVPLHIDSLNLAKNKIKLTLAASWPEEIKLTPAGSLYRIIAERFFAKTDSFKFQRLQNYWDELTSSGWPRELGILALYCEWRPANKIFDLYILSSGGAAVFNKNSRPEAWPLDADWQEDFADHELCVSKASWKIENLNL